MRPDAPVFENAGQRNCPWSTLWVATGCLLALAIAVFVWPGGTYAAKGLNDVFGFFDAMHRLDMGQQPHVDFHTPVGWLAYGLPYLGYAVLGQFGGALEFGSVALLGMLLPLAALALRGRAPTGAGLLLLAALFAVVAVPWPLGESGLVSTQVLHYNRWGWALLTTLLLFGLPVEKAGERGSRPFLAGAESAAIAALLSMLFFLKITYFVVGLGFVLLFGVALARFRRAAGWGLAFSLFLILVIQWSAGWVDDYLRDLWRTTVVATQSGAHHTPGFADVLLTTLSSLGLAGAACGIAGLVKRLSLQDCLLATYILASCVALATQNSMAPNFLFALLPVFVAMAARCPRGSNHRRLVMVCMWIFLLPAFARQLLATAAFLMAAHGHCPGCASGLPRMEGAWFGGLAGPNAFEAGVPQMADPSDALLWSRRHTNNSHLDVSNAEYLQTLRTGLALLRAAGHADDTVAVADFGNAFSVLLDVPSPKGVILHLHVGRFIDRHLAKSKEFVFGDANWLMIPKFPVFMDSTAVVMEAQAAHLSKDWEEAAANDHWRLLRRVNAARATSS